MKQQPSFDEIIDSLDGMTRAAMPAATRERILTKIKSVRGRILFLRGPSVLLMAAGLALLIGFNIYSVASYKAPALSAGMETTPGLLADEYFAPAPAI